MDHLAYWPNLSQFVSRKRGPIMAIEPTGLSYWAYLKRPISALIGAQLELERILAHWALRTDFQFEAR